MIANKANLDIKSTKLERETGNEEAFKIFSPNDRGPAFIHPLHKLHRRTLL